MSYIVDRNKAVPVNTTNYMQNSKISQTKDPAPDVYKYQMNDLSSVFTNWDTKLGKNVTTPNELLFTSDNKNKLDNNGGKNNNEQSGF